uniref:Interleukin 10 receptor, alpha n=1 Tax=Myripristis murdjan TaxID=586833 RepID=A0A667Y8X5_9TELE
MDRSYNTLTLVFVIIFLCTLFSDFSVTGLGVPQPVNPVVRVLDGEVTAVWDSPEDAPLKSVYNVEMKKYGSGSDWIAVVRCTMITVTCCDLTNLMHEYNAAYIVRVQLVAGRNASDWKNTKRVYPNQSKLLPPSFTLLATSSTLTLTVHKKPFYKKMFPFGMTYTIYLEDRGKDNKTTIAYLKDGLDDEGVKTFDSLHWGREYCVSLKVESSTGLSMSNVSTPQCIFLPEQEWYIIAVSCLVSLGVMAIFAVLLAILLCYLKRPEKVPTVLKSPGSGWLPLTVGESPMEVVTDKGWFLMGKEEKNCFTPEQVTQAMASEDDQQEVRRTSTDSGVGVEPNSATKSRGSAQIMQEDSGCGSMTGSESSTSCSSSTEEHFLREGRTNDNTVRKREDSGVELGCQLDCSLILDGQDCGAVAGDKYRSKSPSAVQIHVCDDERMFQEIQTDRDSALADVVTGYRAGHQSCICSRAGQCAWCHQTGHHGPEEVPQYRAAHIENGLLSSENHFVETYEADLQFSNYRGKPHIQLESIIRMDDSETPSNLPFIQLEEAFPLLTALSLLPSVEEGEKFGMKNASLSLCDVELKTD